MAKDTWTNNILESAPGAIVVDQMTKTKNGRLTDVEETVSGKYAFVYWNANDEEHLWIVFDHESDARVAHKMMTDVLERASAIVPV